MASRPDGEISTTDFKVQINDPHQKENGIESTSKKDAVSAVQNSGTSRDESDEETPCPDGGWGWMIVALGFVINMVLDGIVFSFGVYYPIFLREFQCSPAKTSMIGSLFWGCYFMISPVVSTVVNSFGPRKVTIFGSICAGLSFICSSMATNINVLIITWGISTGCAFGLLFLPSITLIGRWFDTKRGIATGISLAGSGCGIFVCPTLCSVIIEKWGWRTSLHLISACLFCIAPFAFIYREVPKRGVKIESAEKSELETTKRPNISEVNKKCILTEQPDKTWCNISGVAMESNNSSTYSSSSQDPPPSCLLEEANLNKLESLEAKIEIEESFFAKAIRLSGVNIFTYKCFILLLMASFISFSALWSPFIYVADYAILKGIDKKKASFLLSLTGIPDVVGPLISGLLVSMKWVSPIAIMTFTFICAGISTILLPFFESYGMMVVYVTVFAFCEATNFSVISLVIINFLGIEKLTSAYGFYLLFMGIGTTVGVPFIGMFYNSKTQSYTSCFVVAGSLMLAGGLLSLSLPKFSTWEKTKYPQKFKRLSKDVVKSKMSNSETAA